jgi:hypothetical protein
MSVETSVTHDVDADVNRLIEPQAHEFTAHFNYEDAIEAWFALDSIAKANDGSVEITTEALGETWDISLYYQESAIQPPSNGVTSNGTEIEHDSIREFRIHCEAQDSTGEKKANFHLRPRWRGMRVKPKDGTEHELSIPQSLVNDADAVNVRVSGANLDFDAYRDLLLCAMSALGASGHRLLGMHETSNIQDAAYYVRVNTDVSGPIHSRDGPLVSLAHVLQNDRSGYRKLVQNDSNERNEPLPGYYHTATLGVERVREVMPSHSLPVECKHYYAREAHDKPSSDPLAHPKVEVAYQSSRHDDTLHLNDQTHSQLDRELTEWLYAILNDAGLDLRAGGSTYVEDAYFDAENGTTTASVVDLDITEVRHEQRSVVYKHVVNGTPTERECLDVLVSDGGNVSPSDLADETGRHRDTIYDALNRMQDLVEHTYDQVSLKSAYVSELVVDSLREASDSLQTTANAVENEQRGIDETASAFVAWQDKHSVNYRDTRRDDDRLRLDLGDCESFDEAKRILREGYGLWQAMGRDEAVFRGAHYRFKKPTNEDTNLLDEYMKPPEQRQTFTGKVWHALD